MTANQISYDSANAKSQWRCQLHLLKPVYILSALFGLIALIVAGKMPIFASLSCVILAVAINFAVLSRGINRRCRSPRLCTTTLSDEGVRDQTPDGDRLLTWREIHKVEFADGDVYFYGRYACVWVPLLAFVDREAAHEFYKAGFSLWETKRGKHFLTYPLTSAALPIGGHKFLEDGPIIVEDARKTAEASHALIDAEQYILEHDESVWKELEKKHEELNQKPGEEAAKLLESEPDAKTERI